MFSSFSSAPQTPKTPTLDDNQREQQEEAAAIPQQHKSSFMAFLSSLASFTGDLSQMTAPAFLLNGISLLEYSAHWGDFPQYMVPIYATADPADRMLAVTKWVISTLYGSYHERCANGSEKKPYNPILGEQFFCEWRDEKKEGWEYGRAVVEQVSHHPPISAFYLNYPSLGIHINGHCGQKSRFKTMTVKVEQTGRCKMTIEKYNETIILSLPELTIRGLLSGNIFLELSGVMRITSSSGYEAAIEFQPKPWFVGEYHHIKGTVYKVTEPDTPLYLLSGKWTDTVYYKKPDTKEEPFFDFKLTFRPPKFVKPIHEQGELEARRIWNKVTEALVKGDYSTASREKNDLEEKQREIRKKRKEENSDWNPKYFEFVQDTEQTSPGKRFSQKLFKSLSSSSLKLMDSGYWKFKNSEQ